ncbi:MAG: RNA polymerase sigma factor SigJ [Ilumatobacteraceae bacterium]
MTDSGRPTDVDSAVAPDDAAVVDVTNFEIERRRLLGLAYRMTGTPDDADDVVQDVWLRWQASDRAAIANPAAWLTTVTTRVALDRLTSATARREQYVGPWVPEPFVSGAGDASSDPADAVTSSESITLGFLRVLETLQPIERAVFLLHDVFALPFADIATTVDRSEPAVRQIAKRARDRVRDGRPRLSPPPDEVQQLSDAFLAAIVEGDVDRLAAMLTDDVVHISDGGADHRAGRRPIFGPEKVARLFVNLARRKWLPTDELYWVDVNGHSGAFVVRDDAPYMLTVLEWRDRKVAEVIAIVNPDKLQRFFEEWQAGRA